MTTATKYKTYSKYKSSGIDWLGDIPEGWEADYLKNLGHFASSGIDKKTIEGEPLIQMVNYTDIYGNETRIINSDRDFMTVSCPAWKIPESNLIKGDLVFTPSSETIEDIGLSALIFENLNNTVFSYHVVRFRFSKPFDHGFKKYLCNNNFVLQQFSSAAKGTTRQILDRNDFKSIHVVVPSVEEQKKIADFLDRETAKIDEMVAKKQKMMELLKEKRQAIITHAVTKGLDPKAKMKPSGIDWLGDIPVGWEMKRAKYLGRAIIGLTYSPDEVVNEGEGVLILRSSNIQNGLVELNDNVYVKKEIPEDLFTKSGDILICSRNGSVRLIGKNILIDESTENLSFGAFMTIFRSRNYEFLYYFFNSSLFISQTGLFSTSTINQLTTSILDNLEIPTPPSDAQQKIVKFLKSGTAKIDEMMKKVEIQISKLQEYRQALITDAVTGKIMVN